MKNALIKVSKRILGAKIYSGLRARFVFRKNDSPFPMYPPKDFKVDWKAYRTDVNRTKAVYIMSPTQRSGTNFLSHIMNMHPQLVFPDSAVFPNEHCLYTYIDDIKKYAYKTVSTWSKWTENSSMDLQDQVKSFMAHIGDGILSYFSYGLKQDQLLLLKTPDAGHIGDYFHLFPNTKVIVLMRDGRDTMESFSKSWGGDENFKRMTARWNNRAIQINEFIKNSTESGFLNNICTVDYDKLNLNSKGELEKIFEFLGLDPSLYPWDQLDKIPVLGSSNFRGEEDKVNWKPVQKDDNFKPTGKWKSWNSGKKKLFKKIAGKQMEKFGYSRDNNW